jgi:3-hydroxyisobutyrate dehydrogenase-like beta-hydroxyacid dehydrogenase
MYPACGGPRELAGGQAPAHVGLLGLGEAGTAVAGMLARAGVSVRAWSPSGIAGSATASCVSSPADAATGADVVLNLTLGSVALAIATQVAPALGPGVLYADLTTAAPAVMREAAAVVERAGALFADVGVFGSLSRPVPAPRFVASGSGAEAFSRAGRALGWNLELLRAPAGEASARKLISSVFVKGMAAAICESLDMARAHGCADWFRESVVAELTAADRSLVTSLEGSWRRHAARRSHELLDACELGRQLRVATPIAEAAAGSLRRLQVVRPADHLGSGP